METKVNHMLPRREGNTLKLLVSQLQLIQGRKLFEIMTGVLYLKLGLVSKFPDSQYLIFFSFVFFISASLELSVSLSFPLP